MFSFYILLLENASQGRWWRDPFDGRRSLKLCWPAFFVVGSGWGRGRKTRKQRRWTEYYLVRHCVSRESRKRITFVLNSTSVWRHCVAEPLFTLLDGDDGTSADVATAETKKNRTNTKRFGPAEFQIKTKANQKPDIQLKFFDSILEIFTQTKESLNADENPFLD